MTQKTKLRPIVKIHGGKHYLNKWIIEHFPKGYESMTYCEPFCGAASVFLNKERSQEEVINDLDDGLVCILKALRDESKEFIQRIKRTKYTERAFLLAYNKREDEFEDYVDHAVNEYVVRRMSRGGMREAFAWSTRLRGGKPGDQNAWETMIEQLPIISERLQGITILHGQYHRLKIFDDPNNLTYFDPPYLHSTRSKGSTQVYEHEMTIEDHTKFLEMACTFEGKVMISGYSSPLYRKHLTGWKCRKKDVANNSSQAKTKERRIECIWMNY